MALALREIHLSPSTSERQLVAAVRNGDDRAFEQLFARYRRRISAFVYGLVGDHGRAEDITQEVFISALRRLRETDRPVAVRPWLYEIARNACIDDYRRQRRAPVVPLEDESGERGVNVPLLSERNSPEDTWERKQQLGHLCGAFRGLSDNHHRILVLRELEGLSYGEIGRRMGMTRPMVESTLFRARRRLTQEYDELASGRRCEAVRAAVDEQNVRALGSRGIRERRRIAHHLAQCSDCLRYARSAGIDDSALPVPGMARKVAALLPFGGLRLPWRSSLARLFSRRGPATASARPASRGPALAQGTPTGLAASRAAAAAAALLVTGTALPLQASHHRQGMPSPAPIVTGFMADRQPVMAPGLAASPLRDHARAEPAIVASYRNLAAVSHAAQKRRHAVAHRPAPSRSGGPAGSSGAPSGTPGAAPSASVPSGPVSTTVSSASRAVAPVVSTVSTTASNVVKTAQSAASSVPLLSSPPAQQTLSSASSAATTLLSQSSDTLTQTASTVAQAGNAALGAARQTGATAAGVVGVQSPPLG